MIYTFVMAFILFSSVSVSAADQPTALCGGFRSSQTVEEVRAQLGKLGIESRWKEQAKASSKNDPRPPYKFVYLTGPFKLSGVDGILKLTFFNGRLLKAQFSPSSSQEYLDALKSERAKLPGRAGEEISTDRRTRFRFDITRDKKLVFTWYDPKLADEWQQWLKTNS